MKTPDRICSCCKRDLTDTPGLTVTTRAASSSEPLAPTPKLLCEECWLKLIKGLDYEKEGESK